MINSKLKLLLITLTALMPLATIGQIIDSQITLTKALEGTDAPKNITDNLVMLDVQYYSTDSLLHQGQIVVNKIIELEVKELFDFIKKIKYPVAMVIPIKFDRPNGTTSMAHLNNTYCFHYRKAISSTTTLSKHSLGLAIDFNPFDNPYISHNGTVKPNGAKYDTENPTTLKVNHPLVNQFIKINWQWGGNWHDSKDYMHFEKNIE